jgi:protein-S-isoprenylcysteine O-methyltransferase Ste14
MEFPSPALMVIFFLISDKKAIMSVIFIIFWVSHYLHRTFVYPFIQPGRNKSYPLLLVLMAFIFNCLNGSVNGYGVFHLLKYDQSWIYSWQFVSGAFFFISGFVINKSAHRTFNRIRAENPEGYFIPKGGLFEFVSCPHYFGEIIEWGGWALMTWSLPGLSFFVFTTANLLPRALSSHNWYREKFTDYPSGRKALVPFLL